MRLAQGCFLSRAAILDTPMNIFEEKISGLRLGSGPISDGRNRLSDAERFAAGLDLDRKRPCWASHARFAVLIGE